MTILTNKLQLALLKSKKPQSTLQKGFTLIELLVVVVIVGVLSAVALPRFLGAAENADRNASFTSALAMSKECASAILLDNAVPAYTTNDLVTVGGTACGGAGVTYANRVEQAADAGTLCIAMPATTTLNDICTITVDENGDRNGAWT